MGYSSTSFCLFEQPTKEGLEGRREGGGGIRSTHSRFAGLMLVILITKKNDTSTEGEKAKKRRELPKQRPSRKLRPTACGDDITDAYLVRFCALDAPAKF